MAAAVAEEAALCRNCSQAVSKPLRCSICKDASYCTPKCQKEDWQFHKRICKRPDPPKPPVPEPDKGAQKEELERMMSEMSKESDPKMTSQVHQMMAGMMGVESQPAQEKLPDPECQSCSKPCSKPLRCGVCKSATYCSAQCQKNDWRFHKRICKKPAAPPTEKEDAPAPTATGEKESAATSSTVTRPKEENEKVMLKNEDVGTWYSHRDWKPEDPQKQSLPEQVAQAAGGSSSATSGSSWNTAGTWEEKNMFPWWQERVEGLKGAGDSEVLQVDKVDNLKGDASIVHVRGQPKFLCDLGFTVNFSGLERCKACTRSPGGSRCSNCLRILGKVQVSDIACDVGATPSFEVQAGKPPGPDHVKKAGQPECSRVAEEFLIPALRLKVKELIDEYQALVPNTAKWASQLPPSEGYKSQ